MSTSSYIASVHRDTMRTFFEASPTVRLLRSDHAPWIIDFLKRVFKEGDSISVGQQDLRSSLMLYQDEIHEAEPTVLTGQTDRYLMQWVDAGWLVRFLQSTTTEPQFQLTRFSEEAIQFADSAIARGKNIVGTESRLRLVMETLEDLVRGASADPDKRLEYLRKQRDALDAEIAAIESGHSIEVYRSVQIRERFQTAVELLRALQSDFRAVEERFQAIAKEVQQRQATGMDSPGNILGHALDSEDLLKKQDEGLSFFTFVRFLFSPVQQAQLRKNIDEIQQLTALADESESMQRLRRMVPSLLAEADKVVKTTARLSSTLRRLLDARALEHRMRLANVLRDIRQMALKLRGKNILETIQLEVQTDLIVHSPMARPFWTAPPKLENRELIEQTLDPAQTHAMASMFFKFNRLDLRKLRRTIRESTIDGDSIALSDLLHRSPISEGVAELLGFLQIAYEDGHLIDRNQVERITIENLRGETGMKTFSLPRIVFQPKASTREISIKPR